MGLNELLKPRPYRKGDFRYSIESIEDWKPLSPEFRG